MSKCYDNPEYDDLGNGLQNTWEHSPLKQEQKQHLIDMMNNDEDLGLYNETFDEYLIRLKDRRTEDDYKYTDEDFEKYDEYIMDSWRCGISVYKCLEFMYFAEKEIKVGDVFNDEKREGIKQFISEHKQKQLENDWEEILFDFIDFYPCILPNELFEWLEENYEIPKKKNGKD